MIFMEQTITMIIYGLLLIFLLMCSYEDIKYKRIKARKVFVFMSIFFVLAFFRTDILVVDALLGMLFGMLFLLISKVTRGQIGEGDGLVIMLLGLGSGLSISVMVVFSGLFLSFFYAVYLMIRNRKMHGQRFAFLPCLLFGYILCYPLWRW